VERGPSSAETHLEGEAVEAACGPVNDFSVLGSNGAHVEVGDIRAGCVTKPAFDVADRRSWTRAELGSAKVAERVEAEEGLAGSWTLSRRLVHHCVTALEGP